MTTPKRALFLWGGMEFHDPRQTSELFGGLLSDRGYDVQLEQDLDILLDRDRLAETDLIVMAITGGKITDEQEAGLLGAVRSGPAPGWAAGMADWPMPSGIESPISTPWAVNGWRIPETSGSTPSRSQPRMTRLWMVWVILRCGDPSSITCMSIPPMRCWRRQPLTVPMMDGLRVSSCRWRGRSGMGPARSSIAQSATRWWISTPRRHGRSPNAGSSGRRGRRTQDFALNDFVAKYTYQFHGA